MRRNGPDISGRDSSRWGFLDGGGYSKKGIGVCGSDTEMKLDVDVVDVENREGCRGS